MTEVKYGYCLDENGRLVHIKSLTDAIRRVHRYHCLQCGQEMVANLGQKKAWYFSHKADTACDGESYLHKLAKQRIRAKFMSARSFPIIFNRDFPCENKGKCPHYREWVCQECNATERLELKYYRGKLLYDSCLEEVKCGEFRPDLLLKCSTKPDAPPIFIEIYKTHQSSEEKVNSEYRIIETKKIESEADIDDIIKRGFVEGENCTLKNFHPKHPIEKSKVHIPVARFILYNSGKAYVEQLHCGMIDKRIKPQSAVELNVRTHEFDIGELKGPNTILGTYEKGLVYLKKKGMPIRNCILCRHYNYDHTCRKFNIHIDNPPLFPEQSQANICEHYELNEELTNYTLSKLEEDVSRVTS